MIKLYVYMKSRLYSFKSGKKAGDDKLVVSLVLIAVGVVLCFLYRDQIKTVITSAIGTLTTKINEMFNSSGSTGTSA